MTDADTTDRSTKQREPLNIEDLDPLEGAWRRQQEERDEKKGIVRWTEAAYDVTTRDNP